MQSCRSAGEGDIVMLVLVSLEIESDSEDIEKEKTTRDIEQEIECPRCYDVMALSSDFISRVQGKEVTSVLIPHYSLSL
jgi:hypothetical protein